MDINSIISLSKKAKVFEDLYNIPWKLMKDTSLEKKHYHKLSVGLFNIPCGGFGDIIVCKTLYDYLQKWYPGLHVTICSSAPEKYSDLGIKDKILRLSLKDVKGTSPIECADFNYLIMNQKKTFDIMIIVPIINKTFEIKKFQKLIPYANVFNTFTMSEYNGEFSPYTLPIGVGKGQLGILLNDFPIKQQTLISKPYSLVYIQPSPSWGVHARYCFYSYLEMICKKYSGRYSRFQMIIPEWISNDLNENNTFYYKVRKIILSSYENIDIIYSETEKESLVEGKGTSRFTFRADILPQKRDIFISLMKDSIPDILVTGDQSITDVISCCKGFKKIWYQIAPWKQGLAYHLSKELPNDSYESFKTSCGTLRTIKQTPEWSRFIKENDFRIYGRKRIDQLLLSSILLKKNKSVFGELLDIIERSRYLETAQKKIDELK